MGRECSGRWLLIVSDKLPFCRELLFDSLNGAGMGPLVRLPKLNLSAVATLFSFFFRTSK